MNEKIREESTENATETEIKEISSDESQINQKRKRVSQDLSEESKDILGTGSISMLLRKFAIPSVIAMLVGAMYNIVDQIFIGQGVGMLGNAATNVAFPITTISLAVALLLGNGAASNFNLQMGRKNPKMAAKYVGNAITLMGLSGIALLAITLLFMDQLLILFGATDQVFEYAKTYMSITAFGLPFIIFTSGGANLVRSDGSPQQSMFIMLAGAIINTILDPLFIFVFNWGIAGAAWATVIGQFVSFLLIIKYFFGYKTVHLVKEVFVLKIECVTNILKLGVASFFNQVSMAFVQIIMNSTLRHYGELSIYGPDIPLASAGIITKINMMVFAIVIGIAQGSQPILGYNYGAKNYDRVKKTLRLAITYSVIISATGFAFFQLFPRQIIGVFGSGSEEYFAFATKYLRIFMFMVFITPIQPIVATFFTSIGKAGKGFFMSLTRQVLFLAPLIIILPRFMGIEGVVFAGPIADTAAVLITIFFLVQEIRIINKEIEIEKQKTVLGQE